MSEPPQYTEYPRAHRMASGVQPLPPGVHIEALSEAINLFQRNWGTYVLATLIFGIIFYGIYFGGYILLVALALMTGSHAAEPNLLVVIPLAIVWIVVLVAAYVTLSYGIAAIALKQIRGYPISVGDMFGVVRFAPRLVGVNFCMGLVSIVGIICLIVPGLWFSGSLALSPFIAIDQDKGVFDSLNESWRVAGSFSTGISMFGIMLLVGMLSMVGSFFCGIGLLVTLPIGLIAMCVEYFYFFPEAFGVPGTSTQG